MMNSKMKVRMICLFLFLGLIRMGNGQPSDQERQTQATDHSLVYIMGIAGGGVAQLMVCCHLEQALEQLHSVRPALYEENIAAARFARIFAPIGGVVAGSAAGYLLECIFQQSELSITPMN